MAHRLKEGSGHGNPFGSPFPAPTSASYCAAQFLMDGDEWVVFDGFARGFMFKAGPRVSVGWHHQGLYCDPIG